MFGAPFKLSENSLNYLQVIAGETKLNGWKINSNDNKDHLRYGKYIHVPSNYESPEILTSLVLIEVRIDFSITGFVNNGSLV